MNSVRTLLIATPAVLGLLAAPAAHAEWRGGRGGWGDHRGHWDHGGGYRGPGPLGGLLLGLGAAAVVGGIIASQPAYAPPPVYYAPQPGYYPAPSYYAPPAYYAPQPYPDRYYPQ